MTAPTYHLWVPNIFEFKGGIQVYSAFLIQALRDVAQESRCAVYLKHDRKAPDAVLQDPLLNYHCLGGAPKALRTAAFAVALAVGQLKDRPDLTISTHLNFSRVARWTRHLTRRPYWVIAHGIEAWNLSDPGLIAGLRHADRILAVSNYTRERLLDELSLPADQISVLPNTFDQDRFVPSPKPVQLLSRHHLSAASKIILTVARLDSAERYKGYDQILRAMPEILRAVPEAHYLLVGSGNDRNRLEHLIRELKLEPHVTLAGFVTDQELCDYYNLCDAFAMPSKGEGFGIVYLEALSCGRPVLGGNKDGALDALVGGELGILVDPDNQNEITANLIGMLKRTLPHPLIFRPTEVRARVIERFGFTQFRENLRQLLSTAPCAVDLRRAE